MPVPKGVDKKKYDSCVEQLKKQGDVDNPYAVCAASLTGQTQKSIEDIILENVDFTKAASASEAKRVSGGVEYRGTKFPGFNKPRKSTKSEKKKMVLAKKGDKIKVVHYGATGYRHNYSPEAKRSFRARHKCDQQKDKFSAAYWACRDLWPTGSTKKANEMQGEDPCWEGYEMVGFKMKDGKKVPNCVPKSESKKSIEEALMHDEPKDVLIAIPVPLSVAKELELEDGIHPTNMHITLAYLDPFEIDHDRMRSMLSDLSKKVSSFPAKISGLGRFDHGDVDVLYASVDSPMISHIQHVVMETLIEHCGITPDMEHGFNPHITLKYIERDEEIPPMKEDMLQEWRIDSIEFWSG
jgi:2'-5' RNA ligase